MFRCDAFHSVKTWPARPRAVVCSLPVSSLYDKPVAADVLPFHGSQLVYKDNVFRLTQPAVLDDTLKSSARTRRVAALSYVLDFEKACSNRNGHAVALLTSTLIDLFDRLSPFSPTFFLSLFDGCPYTQNFLLYYIASHLAEYSVADFAELDKDAQWIVWQRHLALPQSCCSSSASATTTTTTTTTTERFSLSCVVPQDGRIVLMLRQLFTSLHGTLDSSVQNTHLSRWAWPNPSDGTSVQTFLGEVLKPVGGISVLNSDDCNKLVRCPDEAVQWLWWLAFLVPEKTPRPIRGATATCSVLDTGSCPSPSPRPSNHKKRRVSLKRSVEEKQLNTASKNDSDEPQNCVKQDIFDAESVLSNNLFSSFIRYCVRQVGSELLHLDELCFCICDVPFYCHLLESDTLNVLHEDVVADAAFRILLSLIDKYIVTPLTDFFQRDVVQCTVPSNCRCFDVVFRSSSSSAAMCCHGLASIETGHVFEACFRLTQLIRWRTLSTNIKKGIADVWSRVMVSVQKLLASFLASKSAFIAADHDTLQLLQMRCNGYMESLNRLFSGVAHKPNWKRLTKAAEEFTMLTISMPSRATVRRTSENSSGNGFSSGRHVTGRADRISETLWSQHSTECETHIRCLSAEWIASVHRFWHRDRQNVAPVRLQPLASHHTPPVFTSATECKKEVSRFSEDTEWSVVGHPFGQCLEVTRKSLGVTGASIAETSCVASDVMVRRPREIPLQVRTQDGQGVKDGECRVFECEFLWKMTRCSVGSHPLVGVVSSKGKLPSTCHGTFEQQPGEFGWAVDLETSEVCFSYGAASASSPLTEDCTTAKKPSVVSRRTSSRLTQRALGRFFQDDMPPGAEAPFTSTNRSDLNVSDASSPSIAQFLAVRYLKSVSMVLPLRLTIDRRANTVQAAVPPSSVTYEETFPQLALIRGPLYPAVALSSGGFRGFFGSIHPLWVAPLAFTPRVRKRTHVDVSSLQPAHDNSYLEYTHKRLFLKDYNLLSSAVSYLLDSPTCTSLPDAAKHPNPCVTTTRAGSRTLRRCLCSVPQRRRPRPAASNGPAESHSVFAPKRFSLLRQPGRPAALLRRMSFYPYREEPSQRGKETRRSSLPASRFTNTGSVSCLSVLRGSSSCSTSTSRRNRVRRTLLHPVTRRSSEITAKTQRVPRRRSKKSTTASLAASVLTSTRSDVPTSLSCSTPPSSSSSCSMPLTPPELTSTRSPSGVLSPLLVPNAARLSSPRPASRVCWSKAVDSCRNDSYLPKTRHKERRRSFKINATAPFNGTQQCPADCTQNAQLQSKPKAKFSRQRDYRRRQPPLRISPVAV